MSQPRGRSLPARPITASPPGGPGLMGDSEGRDLPRGRANRGRACLPATQSRKATEERHPMSGGGGRGWRSGRARRSPRLGPSRPRSAAMAAVGDDGSGVGSSIGLLLEAAEYLERRERGTGTPPFPPRHLPVPPGAARSRCVPTEAEHGYASLLPGAGRARRESPRRRGKGRRSGGGGRYREGGTWGQWGPIGAPLSAGGQRLSRGAGWGGGLGGSGGAEDSACAQIGVCWGLLRSRCHGGGLWGHRCQPGVRSWHGVPG